MSEFENEDEQLEVDVELYALDDDDEEEFDDTDGFEYEADESDEPDVLPAEDFEVVEETEEAASYEAAPSDIEEQADAMLDGIKSDSTYALHTETDAENFDPDEAPANAVVDSEDVVIVNEESSSISEGDDIEELPESIEIPLEEDFHLIVEDPAEAEAKAARSRRRLRNVLIFFIVILILVGAAMGIFVWRNNTPPDVKPTDPDDMRTSKQANNQIFSSIESDRIPDLATYFGLTPEQAAEQCGGIIALDAQATPATDAALPELKALRNGWVVSNNGDVAVSITFGLDKDNKIMYTLATFDLDAYDVADAKFEELISSNVIAESILRGVGLQDAAIESAAITVVDKPDAVTSRDTAGKEIAEFSGPTNLGKTPNEWKLTEVYDHTAGASLGDNSVIRSLSIDLR